MYYLPYFKDSDSDVIHNFMRQHPFAMLIGCSDAVPVATQVPLLIEERNGTTFLIGHIMRSTDHHKAFEKNNRLLCVFTGAHTYVSASWYSNPQVASTWNYMSVQARGTLRFLPKDKLLEILNDTTRHFENNPESPALFEHLSDDYVQRLASAIIGFEVEVEEVNHVFKLSQNRDKESYANIISHLQHGDADAQVIAAEMQKRQLHLFTEK